MKQKKLQTKSKYDEFDMDNDGVVTDKEIAQHQEMMNQQLLEEKSDTQRKMAWVAMISMCVFALIPLLPFIPENRLSTLASLSDMLFLSQASIVGLYFGAQAYMAKR